jgi:hypothetical protein
MTAVAYDATIHSALLYLTQLALRMASMSEHSLAGDMLRWSCAWRSDYCPLQDASRS